MTVNPRVSRCNPAGKDVPRLLTLAILLLFAASSCQAPVREQEQGNAEEMPSLAPVALAEGERLRPVATTNIVADVVQNVGGDLIDLTTLMPWGTDPHAFEPTPQDVAAVADAHVLFINGAGLEIFLEPLLESVGEDVAVVPVSHGVELLRFQDSSEHEEGGQHQHPGDLDPHTWFDPTNVVVWTHNIEHTLSTLDPGNAESYEANAEACLAELEALDAWIRQQVAQVPEVNRRLVTEHSALGYFAHRYGFEQIGAVIPGYSTLAAPSAQDLADLEDAIVAFDVKAIFVSLTVNPDLAQRVAEDTGTQLVSLHTGSLSRPGGPADSYIALMKYDVTAIVSALR
jgi:ABC-type Zn uptake system ZnuABC Zn-binding protein ZnuA